MPGLGIFGLGSPSARITLVLEESASPVRALWALMDLNDIDSAREALRKREGCAATDIDSWLVDEASPQLVLGLPGWADARAVDGVVWTALPPKFRKEARTPEKHEVVQYLGGLTGALRDCAERYVRFAPRQIDTAYRRHIEATLHWTACEPTP